jgi:hypothetical protein
MGAMPNTCSPSMPEAELRPGTRSGSQVRPPGPCGAGLQRAGGGTYHRGPTWRPGGAGRSGTATATVEQVRQSPSSVSGGAERSCSRGVIVRRRQAVALGLLAAAAAVALSLPWGGAGGRPLAISGSAPTGGALVAHHEYVVQPGDSLWTIAARLDPSGDPRPLVDAMTAQIGGTTPVAGERILLP